MRKKLGASGTTVVCALVAMMTLPSGPAAAAGTVVYEGTASNLVGQYKADVDAFGEKYNKKTVHLMSAAVASITLGDAKSGAPWLIALRDESGTGTAANIACFVSPSLSGTEKQRALVVKKADRVDVVATVAADGFSLGLTNCKIVARGLTIGTPSRSDDTPPSVAMPQRSRQANVAAEQPPLTIVVTNAWNDMVNGVLFVHDAIAIKGGPSDVTLQPDDFLLAMRLSNGARKSYPSMAEAAPTYQKLSALSAGNIATAYEVDPKDDLGAIGPMTIPAHGNVRIVVTFQLTDSVASPTDNRTVSLR